MLSWSLVFFLIAIVAGLFGFKKIQGAATTAAKVLFFLFLFLFLVSLFSAGAPFC